MKVHLQQDFVILFIGLNMFILLLFGVHKVFSIDLDEVLNDDYILNRRNNIYNESVSTWDNALNTMSFHRNMMNEYLCRNYLAQEIVDTVQNKTETVIGKRMGNVTPVKRQSRDSLMGDPGSRHYKNWLSRSSTLEDLYRHYENLAEAEDAPVYQSVAANDGEVTGYAMVGNNKVASSGHSGYGAGTTYGVPDYGSHHNDHDDHDEKGMKLKDLFHLALTAIAFLAFGTFIIEVIMCAMGAETTQTTPQIMVMPSAGLIAANYKTDQASETPSSRQQRDLNSFNIPIDVLNMMSSRVLTTIESFSVLYEDDGHCLRRTLCEGNKYSRTLSGTQKIWLPFWSFGASWFAGLLLRNKPRHKSSVLDYLSASTLGIGNADCRALYPKCTDASGHKIRRKRKARNFHEKR